jgi:protein involved in ribonucleotide reduction
MTGNVKRFVEKLDMMNVRIHKDLVVDEPYVLITYTTKMGEVPKTTNDFLLRNSTHIKGVSSSGNLNWGRHFALASEHISSQFNIPILLKFELAGTEKDIMIFLERLREVETY